MRWLQSLITGIIIATIGVLLRKALLSITGQASRACARHSDLG